MSSPDPTPPQPLRWPRIALFMVALFFLACVFFMVREVKRIQRIRKATDEMQSSPTNATETPAAKSWTNGMIWIPGGTFQMGSRDGQADEQPVHKVTLDGFWLDQFEVTNEKFEQFVRATAYVTVAERKPDPKDFPGAPPENLVPGSVVFTPSRM